MSFKSNIALLVSFFTLPLTHAWTVPTYLDLAYPPLLASGYVSSVANNTNQFPCSIITPSDDTPRVNFPITSGRLQFSLFNSSHALPGHEFIVSIYLGQISDDDSDGQTAYSRFSTLIWKDFASGTDCSVDVLDASKLVGMALGKTVDGVNTIGLNATFGLSMVLVEEGSGKGGSSAAGSGGVVEEMWQCGYITFAPSSITSTENLGYCNSGPIPSFAPTPVYSPSTQTFAPLAFSFPPSNPAPSPATSSRPLLPPPIIPQSGWNTKTTTKTSLGSDSTSTAVIAVGANTNSSSGTGSGSKSHSSHLLAVGIGIGVSLALGSLFIILLLLLLKRKRERTGRGTIAAGFWVEGREGRDGGMAIGDRDVKGGSGSGSGGSTGKGGSSRGSVSFVEEPLPVYEEVVKGSGGGARKGDGVEIELREIRPGPEV